MSFTQIEIQIINALGTRGAMGVTTLMPTIEGLEGKAQLINVLKELETKKITKKQSNSQWVVLKSVFAQLQKEGSLKVQPVKKAAPQKATLQDIPTTQDISAPAKRNVGRKTTDKPSITDMVHEVMSTLPPGASLGITSSGLTLFWNQVTLEPSTEELEEVMQSIKCLQKHVA